MTGLLAALEKRERLGRTSPLRGLNRLLFWRNGKLLISASAALTVIGIYLIRLATDGRHSPAPLALAIFFFTFAGMVKLNVRIVLTSGLRRDLAVSPFDPAEILYGCLYDSWLPPVIAGWLTTAVCWVLFPFAELRGVCLYTFLIIPMLVFYNCGTTVLFWLGWKERLLHGLLFALPPLAGLMLAVAPAFPTLEFTARYTMHGLLFGGTSMIVLFPYLYVTVERRLTAAFSPGV